MSAFAVGTVFRHGSWLEPGPGREKALCRVTALRHGQVYYGFGAEARKGRYIQSPEKLLANGAVITCSGGHWPIEEYGAQCPSCVADAAGSAVESRQDG